MSKSNSNKIRFNIFVNFSDQLLFYEEYNYTSKQDIDEKVKEYFTMGVHRYINNNKDIEYYPPHSISKIIVNLNPNKDEK